MIEVNRQGEVWVFAEQERQVAARRGAGVVRQGPGAGRHAGSAAGGGPARLRRGPLADELIAHGVDKVYVVDDPRLEHYQTLPLRPRGDHAHREAQAADRALWGHGAGPGLGAAGGFGDAGRDDRRLHRPADQQRRRAQTKEIHDKLLLQIRPAFGGNIIATIVNYDRWPQMATVREGVMRKLRCPIASRRGEIVEEKVELDDSDWR